MKHPNVRPYRQFAYLTQGAALTSKSNPRLNSAVINSSFDTFYLSFSNNGSGDLFFPKSTFQQGRNALLRLALSMEVFPGYDYFVFTDEDVQLENVDDASHFWKTSMSTDPWVRMEVPVIVLSMCRGTFPQEFLLKFKPMVGFGRYDNWVQTKNSSGVFSITTTHDQCLGAYSRSLTSFYTNFCGENENILQAYVAVWPTSYRKLLGQAVLLESRTHAEVSGEGKVFSRDARPTPPRPAEKQAAPPRPAKSKPCPLRRN